MASLVSVPDNHEFPLALPEPESYYTGVDDFTRPRARNVIVFLRTRSATLQQRNFANRSHHRHVLMLVLETPGSVIVDGREVRLEVGQGLLVRPFQFHHYINLAADALRWLFITFDLETGGERLPELDFRVLRPSAAALSLWSRIARCWQAQGMSAAAAEQAAALPLLDMLLAELTDELTAALSASQAAPQIAPSASVTALGAVSAADTQSGNPAATKTASSWTARAESLLVQSIETGWTVEEVAARLGISGRALRTRFEAQTGVNIRRYRANYQLHRAMALMSGSTDTLGEIAERCGFHSLPVFSRFIQRETGMSPRTLRQSL